MKHKHSITGRKASAPVYGIARGHKKAGPAGPAEPRLRGAAIRQPLKSRGEIVQTKGELLDGRQDIVGDLTKLRGGAQLTGRRLLKAHQAGLLDAHLSAYLLLGVLASFGV